MTNPHVDVVTSVSFDKFGHLIVETLNDGPTDQGEVPGHGLRIANVSLNTTVTPNTLNITGFKALTFNPPPGTDPAVAQGTFTILWPGSSFAPVGPIAAPPDGDFLISIPAPDGMVISDIPVIPVTEIIHQSLSGCGTVSFAKYFGGLRQASISVVITNRIDPSTLQLICGKNTFWLESFNLSEPGSGVVIPPSPVFRDGQPIFTLPIPAVSGSHTLTMTTANTGVVTSFTYVDP
jgi:hypothetical protein